MVLIVGSFSLLAIRFLRFLKAFPYCCGVSVKSLWFGWRLFFVMCACSVVASVWLILSTRGFPCLAVVGYASFCWRSMSFTFRVHTSTGRIPVSRLSCSLGCRRLDAFDIKTSSFSCVGSFGDFGCGL